MIKLDSVLYWVLGFMKGSFHSFSLCFSYPLKPANCKSTDSLQLTPGVLSHGFPGLTLRTAFCSVLHVRALALCVCWSISLVPASCPHGVLVVYPSDRMPDPMTLVSLCHLACWPVIYVCHVSLCLSASEPDKDRDSAS